MHAKQTTSESRINQQPTRNGLTEIMFTGYPPEIEIEHNKLSNDVLKNIIVNEKDNPNMCIAEAITGFFLPNESLFEYKDMFGEVQNPCEIQFGSLVLNFENKHLANKAFDIINALCHQNPGKLGAVKTVFNDVHSITIPAACTKYFLVNILGFDKKAYSKIIRDVATLQRAQQTGTISSIKTSDDPTRNEVRPDTKSWVENSRVCSIDYGDAIPFHILQHTLHKHLKNKRTYEEFARWTPDKLNKELQTGILPYKKGSYHPINEGWLTTTQAAILLYDVLKNPGEPQPNILETVNKLLNKSRSEVLKRSIAFTSPSEKSSDALMNLLIKRIQILTNIPEITAFLPNESSRCSGILSSDIPHPGSSKTNVAGKSSDLATPAINVEKDTTSWVAATMPNRHRDVSYINSRNYTSSSAQGKIP